MAAARESCFGHGSVAVHGMLRAFPSPRDAGPSPRKKRPYKLHWGPPVALQPAWCPVSDLLYQGEDAWTPLGPRTPSLGRPWVGYQAHKLEGTAISLQHSVHAEGSAARHMLTSRPAHASQQREPYVHPTGESSGGPGMSGRSWYGDRPSSARPRSARPTSARPSSARSGRAATTPGSSPRRSMPASPRTPRGASPNAMNDRRPSTPPSAAYAGSYKWGLPEAAPTPTPQPKNPSMVHIGTTMVLMR